MTLIKICGITNSDDADHAIESGANMVGFVFDRQSPRYVGNFPGTDEAIERASEKVPIWAVFGVLRLPDSEEELGMLQRCSVMQYAEADPEILSSDYWESKTKVRAIRVKTGQSVDEILRLIGNEEMILMDAYHKNVYGGSGAMVDWDLAATVRDRTDAKIILAGGLTPANVIEAVMQVRPYAVDVSSGVEASPGIKDILKIKSFISAVQSI